MNTPSDQRHEAPVLFSSISTPVRIIAAIIAIALVIGAAFLLSGRFLPGQTPEFAYMSQGPLGEEVYLLEGRELVPPELNMEGRVIEIARGSNQDFGLVRTIAASSTDAPAIVPFEINVFRLSGEPEAVTKDGTFKMGLAVSKDSRYLAYSYSNPLLGPSQSLAFENRKVRLMDLEEGAQYELGQGTDAHFIERDGKAFLAFVSTGGLTIYNLEEHIPVLNSAVLAPELARSARVAPDGAHLIYHDPASSRWSLFRVEGLYPVLELASVGRIPTPLQSAVVSGSNVYGLTKNEGGQYEIRVFDSGSLETEGKVITTLPAEPFIGRINLAN